MKFWAKHFLWCELFLGLALFGVFVEWDRRCGAGAINDLLEGNRSQIYGALASIFGTLLGFVITAVAILLSFATTHTFALLRKSSHYPTLWKTYTSAIRVLAAATIVAIVALIADREEHAARWALYATVLSTVLAMARLIRCLWILEKVIQVVTSKRAELPADRA